MTGRIRSLAGTLCVVWVGVRWPTACSCESSSTAACWSLPCSPATFLGDTFAHILGSLFGRTPLAPSVSPNKSVEGFVAGIVGGTAAVVVLAAIVDEPWFELWEAALVGLAVAHRGGRAVTCSSPRSSARRASRIRERCLGAHGGVLDRVDALLFTVPLGYYLASALV